jgi:hypothetical protein
MNARVILLLLVLVLFPAHTSWSSELSDEARRQITEEAVASIPETVHVRLLAVTDIKGDDDGSLARALTEALKGKRHFVLVEREHLDTLLKEQGLQVSDLVSAVERIKPGRIKGVEGILFGEVLERTAWPLSASMKVHLRLNDVQSGEILMAKDFSATLSAPYRNTVLQLLAVSAVLVVISIYLRSWGQRREARTTAQTAGLRQSMLGQLGEVEHALRTTENALQPLGAKELQEALRKLKFEVGLLKDRIQAARWGSEDSSDRQRLDRSDRILMEDCKRLKEVGGNIRILAERIPGAELPSLLNEMTAKVSLMANRLTVRQ